MRYKYCRFKDIISDSCINILPKILNFPKRADKVKLLI
ncbi:hypothetical protein GAPWK_0299 [Gilliamella apicola]|nr:hypothetical protein GAPWK_0299 [Gilliamella apicola]